MSDHAIDDETGLPIGVEVDSTPARSPNRAVLSGRIVRLEPLDIERHAAALYAVTHPADAARLWLYIPNGPFSTLAEHVAHIRDFASNPANLAYVVIDAASGDVLGQACYLRTDVSNRTIEVGYILYSPALQRSAAATEAMYLMARHVFEDLGYRRYEWKCNDLNAPSKQAALRLGFTHEGLFRQAVIVKGRNRDTAWYSMLDSEWPRLKAAFEAWLNPANFDAEGRQKKRLQDCRA
ncbi:MAG: GNAT family N-acetyltransferase [Beijerinckiaceae bacterium]|nr:GNAT family N-acetyltransferase [Beijerinckiaceae bacterium]